MKNIGGKIIAFLAAMIVAVCLVNAVFTVHMKEFVAVRQFGRIVKVISEPGLNFKIPFIQTTQRVSAATRVYDIPSSDVITRDKKTMIADDYVLWKVVDPVKYIQTLNALDARAQERIDASAYNATKNVISSMTQDEVIAARGEKLGIMITEESNDTMGGYGIEILQTQIKALDLPEDNKDAVYQRMISERQNIAASYKAEGDSEAQLIRNQTDKEVAVTKAEAKKEAAVIEAEGEAEYMRILQEAYNNEDKADFYNYIRSLDALKASLTGNNKTIILDKDSELAKILYGTAE